ncbi:plasmid partition protein ParG [Thalassoglobus sp.]|uniref:plasmid partition protein ParG n=1 Tax=Thalassoglobus sp. TaxID=2795869 RepID=UPI003AA813C1
MSKTIKLSARPVRNQNADTWVESRGDLPPPPKPKRLTIDIDPTLHSRLKLHCVRQDIPIADLIRSLIDESLQFDDEAKQTESSSK